MAKGADKSSVSAIGEGWFSFNIGLSYKNGKKNQPRKPVFNKSAITPIAVYILLLTSKF
ncbi:MAG TPA: hypothetical protein VI461_07415 [Chitinophagaceae bacterium]|nr:hypothetical protein [Chitinophagaceae bacterium]